MRLETIIGVEEHGRHVGQVYQENYARLRRYFETQLGDAAEADACVHETVRRFFFFMEDRCWEEHAEYVPDYLIRIAGGLLCSKRAAGREAAGDKAAGTFDRIRNELMRPFRAPLELGRLFLRAVGGGQPSAKRLPALRRAPAASA